MNNYSKMMRLLGKYGFIGECNPYLFKGKFHHSSIKGNHNHYSIHIYPIPTQGDEANRWECYQKDECQKIIYQQQGYDPFELFKQAIQRVLDN